MPPLKYQELLHQKPLLFLFRTIPNKMYQKFLQYIVHKNTSFIYSYPFLKRKPTLITNLQKNNFYEKVFHNRDWV